MLLFNIIIAQFHPWTTWGFWDYFWLGLISGTIMVAYIIAIRNSRREKKKGG